MSRLFFADLQALCSKHGYDFERSNSYGEKYCLFNNDRCPGHVVGFENLDEAWQSIYQFNRGLCPITGSPLKEEPLGLEEECGICGMTIICEDNGFCPMCDKE